MKKQLGPMDIFFPVAAALIVGGAFEDADIVTVAWLGMLSSTPPTIGISLDKRRYSLRLIRSGKEFTVNIPSAEYYKETDFCGLVSGSNVDKFRKTGFTPLKSTQIRTPLIQECPFNLECRMTSEIELGDYLLVLGEVLETHVDEDKIIMERDRLHIDIAKIDPLVYCATIREYWRLGKKLGKAFHAGKEILEKSNREVLE